MAEVKDRLAAAHPPTSREIRDSIRRTRADMDTTVTAIEEKLSPGELAQEAWNLFRGGSSSSVNRILRIAKQYPMPAAIIGLGLGWMVYESSGGDDGRPASYGGHYSQYAQGPTALDSARQGARDVASDVAGSVRRATEAAGETAGDVVGHARDMASDVADSVRNQASELSRQASELGDQARQGVRQARTGFWDTLEEQPLVVGAATLAAGLLVGLLLPSTPREDELMGKARDSLIEEVKGLGHEALEKGKQVATAAAETLKQGAEAHGLADVADKVRAVGRDVLETVKTEAENLTADRVSTEAPRSTEESSQPPAYRAA